MFDKLKLPEQSQIFHKQSGKTVDFPLVAYIEGDGTGRDIWHASQPVLDAAVMQVYGNRRKIVWWEVFAGEKAQQIYGNSAQLPADTLKALRYCGVGIKGPLSTPVGGGIRSYNVALRQELDLYICLRPVWYVPGVPSPMKHPEKLNITIFRENTEDVYSGIEWQAEQPETLRLLHQLNHDYLQAFHKTLPPDTGLGLKPVSRQGSERLIRAAIRYALAHRCPSVTLVHKGNIMKYTEGAFRQWGYDLAAQEFKNEVISEAEVNERYNGQCPSGKIVLKDRIADAMFQQLLLRPEEYSVIATLNLNGDYLSDAAAAQVGGLGMAPGGNLSDEVALFEATHGTAPKYADLDRVNPGSFILSGAMLLRHLGWTEAAALVEQGLHKTVGLGLVTYDLHRQLPEATLVSCSGFGQHLIAQMEKLKHVF